MASAEQYAAWIVQNADKKGTPEFETVAQAYQLAKQQTAPVAPKPPEDTTPGIARGSVQSFGRGASFGLSDRLGALLSSGLGNLQNTEYGDFGDSYTESLKGIQKERDQFAAAHPVIDTAANVAGGIASGIPVAKGAAMVPGVASKFAALPNWAKFVTSGAAAGGAAGAGNAAPGEMLEGGATGAALGAVAGATIPPAARLAAKGVDTLIGTPARAVVNALRTPESQAARLLSKDLMRDKIAPAQLQANLQRMGPNSTIADAAGGNTLDLAEWATQVPGEARDQGVEFLKNRAKGAGQRTMAALKSTLGVGSTNVDDLTQALHNNMRQVAKTHDVDRILNTGAADMTGNLEKLMTAPTMKGALGRAYSIVGDDIALGRADTKTLQYFDVNPDGTVSGFKDVPTLRALDYVKRGLDSIVSDNTDAITGKMNSTAERANALRRGLLKNIDNINPEYKAYRAAYADEKAGESALNLGRLFMREDSEVTARRLADMTDAEKQYFKAGAARAVYDKIMASPDTGTAYQKFLKIPKMKENLEAAFGGNTPEFKDFMKTLEKEARFGETFNRLGNSATFRRAAKDKDVGGDLTAPIPTSKWGLIKSGLDWLSKPSEAVSSQLLDSILTTDPQKQAAVLQALQGLSPQMSRNILSPQFKSQAGLYGNALLSEQFAR